MKYRRFGKTNWNIGEIGYGMWGMGGWTNSNDIQSSDSLDLAVENGVNFFDTAWGYGESVLSFDLSASFQGVNRFERSLAFIGFMY